MTALFEFPGWIDLFLIIAVLISLVVIARRWPFPWGHRQSCGYNLTGNISGVCPECGTAIEDVH
ncbi:MAG: hypothetical protein GY778_09445 [bacterium]|nr:hypothetical protein [bacterium]